MLLAGILVANFALGYAAAEKGEGKKEERDKGGGEKQAHQDGLGEEWVSEEAEKAKGLAGLDSLTVNYGGRTLVL